MSLRRVACCALALSLLAGCATRSDEVRPAADDPGRYAGWACNDIFDELDTVQQRAADVAYAVDARAGNNVIALSLGVTVFWPALLTMRPDGPDAVELARLKGRHDALRTAAAERPCGPAPEFLTAKQLAALPVAAGERLVYEERTDPRSPAREIVMTVRPLRRGQLEFGLEVHGQRLAESWLQDPVGNVLRVPTLAPGGGFVHWRHLLRRDLALGDVLAGELLQGNGRLARLRGQVIALGVQANGGRPFDAAVIELFGDVQGESAGSWLDGILVVDRRSGVLLRMELRSSDPEFQLRRTLLRVEPAKQAG